MEKATNKIKNWLTNNKKSLVFCLCGFLIGILIMGLNWPERIAKLKDGSEAIVQIDGKKITADDLYNELKKGSGLTALLNIIDNKILDDMYDVEEEADKYAKSQSEYYYSIYESYYGYSKEQFLSENGFIDEEAFITYLKDDYVVQKYFSEYVASTITDSEINKYYNNGVFGEKTVYLFSSSEEDNKLEDVRKALKNKKSFDTISTTFKDIKCEKLGKISFDKILDYGEDFQENLKSLSKGKYSKVFKDNTYGNAVIYIADEAAKPDKKDAKDGIVTILTAEKKNADEKLYYQAFIKLRDEKNINFSDTELAKEYEEYKKQYK